jgi:DNA-binding CsgD family transcriptional regulator
VREALGVRETQILQLVAAGLTTEEIGVTLSIAEPTVEWHIARVFEKLGASDRADAVAIMLREGAPDAPGIADRASPPRRLLPGVSVAATIGVLFAILAGTAFAALYIREQQRPETPSATAAPVRGPATAAPRASSGVEVPPSPTPGSAGATPGSGSVPAPPATPALTPATAPLAPLVPPAAPNTAPPALTPLPTIPVPAPTPPAAPSLPGIPTLPPLPTTPIVPPPLLP